MVKDSKYRPGFMRKMSRQLQGVDQFKQGMSLSWHRQDLSSGDKEFVTEQGSWCGGLCTLMFRLVMLALLYFKVTDMLGGADDVYNQYTLTDERQDPETKVLNFSSHNVLHMLTFIHGDAGRIGRYEL